MAKVQFGFASANSLNNKQVLPLLLAGVLVWGTGTLGHYFASSVKTVPSSFLFASTDAVNTKTGTENKPLVAKVAEDVSSQIAQTAPVQAIEAVGNMAAAAISAEPEAFERQVELSQGENFSDMLADSDIAEADISAVVKVINQVYPHSRVKAGQEFTLGFMRRGVDETLQTVVFQAEPTKEVTIERSADGTFTGRVVFTPLERQRLAARVEIKSSLRESGRRAGVPANIMAALIRVYAHSVDFQRDVHAGDKFEVLYDQATSKDGKPAGDGTIIYAALEVGGKVKPLYRVTFGDGTVDYFDASGQSIKRALLKTPVDGAHVTSGYGMRIHPLFGFSKMHKGVDFGAPTGTPIFAAGSGTVEYVGTYSSYGRYIRIRHNNRVETAYGHMSRFARTIERGSHVNQGEVIGFVGASGRATGPHLHFEVMMGGDQVNPMSVSLPVGRALEGQALNQFRQGEKRIRQEFTDLLTKQPSSTASANAPKPLRTSDAKTATQPKS